MTGAMAGKMYHVIVEKDEDGRFVGSVPELPGCCTQGNTETELLERMREPIELYREVKGSGEPHPSFVAVRTVEV